MYKYKCLQTLKQKANLNTTKISSLQYAKMLYKIKCHFFTLNFFRYQSIKEDSQSVFCVCCKVFVVFRIADKLQTFFALLCHKQIQNKEGEKVRN